jgi:guanylate kinase
MTIMSKGRLIIFSAPSGCGKGTMLEQILKDSRFRTSVSATTRAPRDIDVDGVTYHFMSREDFTAKLENGEFLESAEYCQNLYGTLLSEVDPYIENGINVILEIEVQGAMSVMKKRPDALSIFVLPPSMKELRRRLEKRGTEAQEVIEERLSKAAWEISHAEKYDYVIVNGPLEEAVSDFFAVVRGEELKASSMSETINEVLQNA